MKENDNKRNKIIKYVLIVLVIILMGVGIGYGAYKLQESKYEIKDEDKEVETNKNSEKEETVEEEKNSDEEISENQNNDIENNIDEEIPVELYNVASELVNNNFDLSRIFKTGHLNFNSTNEEVAKVNDARFSTFAELEDMVKKTYVDDVANELLYGENATYFDNNGELYINLRNASLASIYTGRGTGDFGIFNYTDNSFDIKGGLTLYTDPTKESFEYKSYELKVVKDSFGNWKLSEMVS